MASQVTHGQMPPFVEQTHRQKATTSPPANGNLAAAFSSLSLGQQTSGHHQYHSLSSPSMSPPTSHSHGGQQVHIHVAHSLSSPPTSHISNSSTHQHAGQTALSSPPPAQTLITSPSPYPAAHSPSTHGSTSSNSSIIQAGHIPPYNPADPSNGKPTFAPPPTVPTSYPNTAKPPKKKGSFFSKVTNTPISGFGAGLVGGLANLSLANEGKGKFEEWTKQKIGSMTGTAGLSGNSDSQSHGGQPGHVHGHGHGHGGHPNHGHASAGHTHTGHTHTGHTHTGHAHAGHAHAGHQPMHAAIHPVAHAGTQQPTHQVMQPTVHSGAHQVAHPSPHAAQHATPHVAVQPAVRPTAVPQGAHSLQQGQVTAQLAPMPARPVQMGAPGQPVPMPRPMPMPAPLPAQFQGPRPPFQGPGGPGMYPGPMMRPPMPMPMPMPMGQRPPQPPPMGPPPMGGAGHEPPERGERPEYERHGVEAGQHGAGMYEPTAHTTAGEASASAAAQGPYGQQSGNDRDFAGAAPGGMNPTGAMGTDPSFGNTGEMPNMTTNGTTQHEVATTNTTNPTNPYAPEASGYSENAVASGGQQAYITEPAPQASYNPGPEIGPPPEQNTYINETVYNIDQSAQSNQNSYNVDQSTQIDQSSYNIDQSAQNNQNSYNIDQSTQIDQSAYNIDQSAYNIDQSAQIDQSSYMNYQTIDNTTAATAPTTTSAIETGMGAGTETAMGDQGVYYQDPSGYSYDYNNNYSNYYETDQSAAYIDQSSLYNTDQSVYADQSAAVYTDPYADQSAAYATTDQSEAAYGYSYDAYAYEYDTSATMATEDYSADYGLA